MTTTMAFLLSTVRHPKSFNRLAFSLQFRCNLTFNHLTDLRGVQHHLPRLPNLGDEPAFILIRRGAGDYNLYSVCVYSTAPFSAPIVYVHCTVCVWDVIIIIYTKVPRSSYRMTTPDFALDIQASTGSMQREEG